MGTLVTDNIFGLGNTNPIKGSVYFTGNDDFLRTEDLDDFYLDGNFTVEFWIKPDHKTSNYCLFTEGNNEKITFGASNTYLIMENSGSSLNIRTANGTVDWDVNSWHHVAFVRSGTTTSDIACYLNGVSLTLTSPANSGSAVWDGGSMKIGEGNPGDFIGYLSNVRFIKGTALYTTNFTPPTEELTVVENTVLLCCQDSNNPLQEATGKTLTPYGNLMVPVDKPELVTNGDFSNKLVGWDDVSVGTGYVRYDTSKKAAQVHRVDGSNSGRIAQGMGLEAGKVYDVRVRCHSDSNTGLQFRGYKSSDSSLSSTTYSRVLGTYGTTVFHFRYTGESGYDGLWFLPIDNTSTNSYITNISVKEYDPRPGDNLILNGHGNSGKTNEWTDSNTSTFEINAGRIKLTRSGGVGNCSYQALTTVVGQQYTLRADIEKGSGSYADIRVYTDSGFGTMLAYIRSNANTQGLREITFTATTTTTHITFVIDTNGETAYYDNIVVTPVHNYNSSKNVPTFGALADDGVVFVGDTKFDTKRYMVPPTGNTEHRGRGTALYGGGYKTPNAITAIDSLSIQSGGLTEHWGDLSSTATSSGVALGSSTRWVTAGGWASPVNNVAIEYVEFASSGKAISFGNLDTGRRNASAVANSTRGLWGGGYISPTDAGTPKIEYVTIASKGNAAEFGDLSGNSKSGTATGSTTRAVFALGNVAPADVDTLEYVEIATLSDYTDFGNLQANRYGRGASGCSNGVRGLFAGGHYPTAVNMIDYITIASKSDAVDFGDLTLARGQMGATSNGTRGVFMGGTTHPARQDTIDSVIIATLGNAVNWGDFRTAKTGLNSAASDSHGGL